jgi:hypothetical protein
MVRALQMSIVAAVLCIAGVASARATFGCDDGPMSLPPGDDLMRTPAPLALVAADDVHPETARLCTPGATDDPSCRPFGPMLPHGPGPSFLSTELFTLARAASLPPPAAELVLRQRQARLALAPGHVNRLERPPRSV